VDAVVLTLLMSFLYYHYHISINTMVDVQLQKLDCKIDFVGFTISLFQQHGWTTYLDVHHFDSQFKSMLKNGFLLNFFLFSN